MWMEQEAAWVCGDCGTVTRWHPNMLFGTGDSGLSLGAEPGP